GTKFLGIAHNPSNDSVAIYEYVEGFNSKFPDHAQSGFKLDEKIKSEMKTQLVQLFKMGLNMPGDLQFLITPDRHAILIDPEHFSFWMPNGQIRSNSESEALAELALKTLILNRWPN